MYWRVIVLLLLVPFVIGADTADAHDDAKEWADFLEEWLYGTVSGTQTENNLARIDDLQDRIFTAQAAARASTIHFASGSAALDPQAEDTLRELARVAARLPGTRFHVSGHTDAVPIHGRFRSNTELSLARAQHARRFLVAEGIDADRLTAAGYADAFPVGSNAERAGRAENRRVEVHFVPSALRAAANAPSGPSWSKSCSGPTSCAPPSPTTLLPSLTTSRIRTPCVCPRELQR